MDLGLAGHVITITYSLGLAEVPLFSASLLSSCKGEDTAFCQLFQ